MQAAENLKERLAEHRRSIPNADDMPAYKVLQRIIQLGIAAGDWAPGQAIPPERLFAAHTGMSIGTVKKAMLNLVNEGALFRRQGSGTYVATPSLTRQLRRYYLFLEHFDDAECDNAITLRGIRTVPAVPRINASLRLGPQDELVEITRVFRENAEVTVLSRSWFSAKDFPGLDKVITQRFEQVPLFVIIEDDYGVSAAYSYELTGIHHAGAEEAALLDARPGEAVLSIETLNFTGANVPFEYRESLCRTGRKRIFRSIAY